MIVENEERKSWMQSMFKKDVWNPTILVQKTEDEEWMSVKWPAFADRMTLRNTTLMSRD